MQLRAIHVIRFGVLENVHVRGLSTGLNVLYGPNEFGKTSLLEFVRRILFGFPDRRARFSQYMPTGVDRNAGRLTCELRNGTVIDVFRSTGRGNGPLTVTTSSGASLSEDEFKALLGYASGDLYRNVFSLGLSELFETDVTSVPEIRDRLYGAGLGGVWPAALRGHFEKRADELFTKGGRTQVMKQLADEIVQRTRSVEQEHQRLAGYDARKGERDSLKATAEDLVTALRRARAELRAREAQEQLYAVVHDMRAAEQELTAMGKVREVTDETIAELHERQLSLRELAKQIESRQSDLKEKLESLERVTYDPALLEHESDIRSLSQAVTRYRSIREEQLPNLSNRAAASQAGLQQRLATLGSDWTVEKLRTFVLTAGQRDLLRQQETELKQRTEALNNARRKLEMHSDQVLARATDKTAIPTALRIAGAAVLAFGGVSAAIAAKNGEIAVALLSAVAAVTGLIITFLPGTSAGARRDPVAEQLQAQVQKAEESLLAAEIEWSNCLTRVGLSPTLSPEAKDETLRTIEDASRELQHVDETEAQIAQCRKTLADIDDRYRAVAQATGGTFSGVDVAAGIELLETRLTEARTARARRESLTADIHTIEQRLRDLEDERKRQENALREMLASLGVSTPAEIEERYQRFRKAVQLRQTIEQLRHDIESRVGPGEAYHALVETVENTPLEEIRSELDSTQMRINSLESELAETNRKVGALDSELEALESEQELVAREAEIETLKQRLQDAWREWLTSRIALWGINSAVSRYEEERQPEVIRAAQDAFCAITGGRYVKLIKSMDDNSLHVRDHEGFDRTVEQLSRGTREQLYLALRLGLIEQYEQNAEPLPVIMDDILVNFDDERGPRAVQALVEFAKRRQVIVMTCHERARELYRQAGANELVASRDSTA